mgnify:CR=1 FL=1
MQTDNNAVLAFLRVLDTDVDAGEVPETVLCVNNLSQTPQAARLRLPDHGGYGLADLFGGGGFHPVPGDGVLPISLGTRDFFWLRLTADGSTT